MDWQSITVYGIVLAAAAVLARMLYRQLTGQRGAAGCPGCDGACGVENHER